MSVATKLRTAFGLARSGVTLRSFFQLALRRKVGRIDLRNGLTIEGPSEEPLFIIFKEVWINHCYVDKGFDVSRAKVVVDIGAHVGMFALWVAANNPNARVICLEPTQQTCEFLQSNIVANRFSNIVFLQAACGGKHGEAILYSREAEKWGNSLLSNDNRGNQFRPIGAVPVLTLADVFEQFNVTTCNLLKLDCEGSEYQILLNAPAETLAAIERIALEYHLEMGGSTITELEDLLREVGFNVRRIPHAPLRGYLHAHR
ncbi:MAG: FkbM family methyltransferase [Acidobacteria bacterium]|nr:FkbM family methyltransferase [Acidobacteriota bacterium]